jgi:V/A-type H+-transporting ATPase subunit A
MQDNKTNPSGNSQTKIDATVTSIKGSLITAEVHQEVNFSRGEIGYLLHDNGKETEEIMAEIVKIEKNVVYMQVFEETYGLKLNTPIRLTRSNLSAGLLSLEFGPGLLGGRIIDGLGNPLKEMEGEFGYQLKRGARMRMLDAEKEWDFIPTAKVGDIVSSADKIGFVKEYMVDHYIMVPYELAGEFKIVEVSGKAKKRIDDVVAKIEPVGGGDIIELTMVFPAAIKKQIAFGEMIVPEKQLETRMRTVDFLMPVPLGGTFCVPGPFGAGKTVLQHLLAKNSQVDIVVVAACGERAGEVVEMLVEFPEIKDPRTGGSLMDRTIIICNTSSMPVAAREASVYTATAISEHYRQMGLNVLLLADSTSRWAQALRELSGRMEEIPGEEAFPAYMESLISQFYGRSGTLINRRGEKGSLTIGGTSVQMLQSILLFIQLKAGQHMPAPFINQSTLIKLEILFLRVLRLRINLKLWSRVIFQMMTL